MKKQNNIVPPSFMPKTPLFEFVGNKEVTIEGSKGVLQYEREIIRINLGTIVFVLKGKNLNLKYLSGTALIIDGTIASAEFIS